MSLCSQSEKHSGAGAMIVAGKEVCVCVCVPVCVLHAVCIALGAVAERLLQGIQIRERPLLCVCV